MRVWMGLVLAVVTACATPPAQDPRSRTPGIERAPTNRSVTSQDPLAAQGPFQPGAGLKLCHMRVTNAPQHDARGWVSDYAPLISVNGVVLATAPADDACLTSGFGPRFGRPHEGIDLLGLRGSPIYSGGPGRIREMGSASGYGLQLVIDHGDGVYTRYAHLQTFNSALSVGRQIGFGQILGEMGDTGNATAVHLHYEVLTGVWGPQGSYGLTPSNPLSWPAYWPDDVRVVAAMDTVQIQGVSIWHGEPSVVHLD